MNEPKLARTPVDSERVVRELLDAFKSLKTVTAPPTCSPPGKEEQKQPSQQSQGERSNAFNLVGGTLAKLYADPRPRPTTTPFKAVMWPVSDIDEGKPERVPASESAGNAEIPDYQIEAQSSQYGIIEGFCSDHEIIERLQVTPEELQALSDASLLGSLTCKQDALFMLRQVRSAMKPARLHRPESLHVSDEDIELSTIPEDSWMAELIRRESLSILTESDSSGDIEHRDPFHRFVVFSLALVLMAMFMGISIAMC